MTVHRLWRAGTGYALSLGLVAVITGVVALVRLSADVSNVSMLYLLAVLASAVLFGSRPAIVASVAAFLAFNFFFVNPHYKLTVSDEEEWIALGLLLVTGVITGQLAAALRDRARDAERREREAVVMYDVVRLMSEPELQRALTGVAERLRAELDLAAVVIVFGKDSPVRAQADIGDSEAIALAAQASGLSEMILGAGSGPTATQRGTPGRWIRVVAPTPRAAARPKSDRVHTVPVSVSGQKVGTVALVRRPGAPLFSQSDDRLLSALAGQLGLAVERMRLREEATQAEVLRRTDELKTALLNAVSHDLRTPLASIIASAGSLLQQDVSWNEEERREFAKAIVDEAQRLNRLVGNLLDLSRIEAGSLRPDKGWYDFSALIDDVLGHLRPVLSRHAVKAEVPEDLPPIHMDYVEMDEVLSNLLENAVKYTPAGTEIRVSAVPLDGILRVEVADSGPGIPQDALPRLFDPFFRAAAPGGARGTGLGLAVAKGIVEAHGGRISAENRREGGARFVFTLPLATPGNEAEQARGAA